MNVAGREHSSKLSAVFLLLLLLALPLSANALPPACSSSAQELKAVFFYGKQEFLLSSCWKLRPVEGDLRQALSPPDKQVPIGYRIYENGEEVKRVEGYVQNGKVELSNGALLQVGASESVLTILRKLKDLFKKLNFEHSFSV